MIKGFPLNPKFMFFNRRDFENWKQTLVPHLDARSAVLQSCNLIFSVCPDFNNEIKSKMSHVRLLIFSLLQAILLLLNVLALLEHCLHHIGGLQDKDLTNKVGHLQCRIETTDDDLGILSRKTFSSSSMVRASSSTSVAASVRVTISFCLAWR